MNEVRLILLFMTILRFAYGNESEQKTAAFPDINIFLLGTKAPDLKKIYEIHDCKVQILSGSCAYRVIPQRAHCLTLAKVINNILPSYSLTLSAKPIKDILPISVTIFYINTCLGKVTFVTSADGQLQILPVLKLNAMVADISVPIPFGDYEMTARGVWYINHQQLSVKVTRQSSGEMKLSGSAHQALSIRSIGEKFDVDILPSSGIKVLLENIGLGNFKLRRVKVRGKIETSTGDYEIIFSGIPDIDIFQEAHVRVLIVRRGSYKNLAILLELPDYSPVALLKKMFGPTVNRITLLRDRSQTLALFVTNQHFQNFSQVLTAHGSSRWLHRDSKFTPGATLLVTLPFPKRKALDMKVQIFSDGLGFSLPDGENLPADLALTAISPAHITRLDRAEIVRSDLLSPDQRTNKFNKILILRFRYFILNDTYIAAAEQLNAVEEELKEIMPLPLVMPDSKSMIEEKLIKAIENKKEKDTLDIFFKRSERLAEKLDQKRNIEKNKIYGVVNDKLGLAEKMGLLRK
eukprot:gene16809-18505_t